ncbi:hypothetical protein SEA_FEDE_46 [Microbacterium phage Fede]|nr:hypothetical protein SEA_FEDE_46 [Microbacterium phage Fede]
MTALFGDVVGAAAQAQSGSFPITPHASTAVGDLVLIVCSVADSASVNYVITGGTGTWTTVQGPSTAGTGELLVFSKPYAAGDTSYTVTRTGSDAWRVVAMTIPGWDGTPAIVGALGTRAASGGTVNTTAPSITTVAPSTEVFYISYERTNANDNAPTINNGFVTEFDVHTIGGDNLQAIYIASKTVGPGAVGDTTATFTNSNGANSSAILYGVVAQTVAPKILGARLSSAPSHNSLTIGVDLVSGAAVQAVLYDGAEEISSQSVTIDGTSGWGNVVFSSLTPDHGYTVQFFIDGDPQLDQAMSVRTLPVPGSATSFVMVAGSCQFTGSNHPVFDAMLADQPRILAHMGDLHYGDATTVSAWRGFVESSLTAPKMKNLLGQVPMVWTWDNHDRIILDDGGAGTPLNMGKTDQATNTEARKLFGSAGWASSDTLGRTYVIGRVRFIQTDQWTMKDDPDAGVATPPLTFLGAAQKAWFKNVLDTATEEVIVWFCQWTGQNHSNGRWNSFPDETAELEAFINARPALKAKMVLIGGDSHSLQVTDGTRTLAQGQRFAGIPNYNISGFNRSSDAGQGGAGWLVDLPLRTAGQLEADWGGYSRITVTDAGGVLTFKWEAVRVNAAGVTDIMDTRTLEFGEPSVQPFDAVYAKGGLADKVYVGSTQVWP